MKKKILGAFTVACFNLGIASAAKAETGAHAQGAHWAGIYWQNPPNNIGGMAEG